MLRKSVDKFPSTNTYTEPVVKGKIRDYLFIADDTGKEGKGHLSVDMVHDFHENRKSRRLFFHWDIDIHKYTVHKRDDSNFPRNPFPTLEGKITFPDFSLDPCNELSIWHRGLDHKLFAEGKDYQGNDNFTVRNIFVSIDGGRLHLLGRDHDWYETTEDSCIDLMFKGFPPATGLPPQTNYCLGRCAHPHLVNTCGD